ncbi:DUF2975 domain-containing protein [Roseibium sediminicola]|uniref:DUF2975 domain-containing protein n=1 Tax=Roseibium sediminicola TaxID=2933272 RepID=A0ABT0GTL6_9HYPH|nr:DUF2975 domain-containing protein [Roseibium sp. CAU 1639]MCK7612787.1 DUF2975 domain-containing protein [Roseibium sp. CAU 1639]
MTTQEQHQQTKRLKRIRGCARAVKWVLTFVVVAQLVFGIALCLSILLPAYSLFNGVDSISTGNIERAFRDMPLVQRALLAFLAAISFILLTSALWTLRNLCARFQKADFFSPRTLKQVAFAGIWLISYAIFDVASDPVAALIATMDFPEAQRIVDVTVDGGEISCMILGALMLLLGWIMREAALLAEENRQII